MTELPTDRRDGSGRYEIRFGGLLASRWAARFDGFTLTHSADGTTVLAGFVIDQAAMRGILRQLADLGLPLISVRPDGATAPAAHR